MHDPATLDHWYGYGPWWFEIDLALWLFDDDPAAAALCHAYFGA